MKIYLLLIYKLVAYILVLESYFVIIIFTYGF